MRVQLDVLKALADESRLRALFALRGGELCVCRLIALLELSPSTVSKHLSILRAAGLVESRKKGRWIYYRMSGKFRSPAMAKILELLFNDLKQSTFMAKDERRLKAICAEEAEVLCKLRACRIGENSHD